MISVAYRSRLVFRTEAEFRRGVGVSYETVMNNRASERDMEMYFGAMSRAAAEVVDEPLAHVIEAYLAASEFYLGVEWGDRSQLASRRKFCRMLFRTYATGGMRLTADELFKFGMKEDDSRLLREFFPKGTDEDPAVDLAMVLLMAFGVLRPFRENSRGRDLSDDDTLEALRRLRGLIEVLKADTPRLGSTEKPLAFDEILGMIEERIAGEAKEREDCNALWMYSLVANIGGICRSLVLAEGTRRGVERFSELSLEGIWIDDADRGRSRFWIFPQFNQMAFCYEYDGRTWRLRPYEFRVRLAESEDYWDAFILVAPEDNLRFILSPESVIETSRIASGLIEGEFSEAMDELLRLTMREDSRSFPQWVSWRRWERLSADDERYGRFHGLLMDLYDPLSPGSLFLENMAPDLVDRINNLIGRDNEYLYVYDWQPRRFAIRERGRDMFVYEVATDDEVPPQSLLRMKVSEEHPLYAIPLELERRRYGNSALDRLAEILTDAENIRDAFIIHPADGADPRLCLPTYGFTIALNMTALAPLGLRKFTRSPFPGG